MQEPPSTPLHIDLRLALETIAAGIAFAFAGIGALQLSDPYNVIVPLALGAILVMVNRLLGKSATDAVKDLTDAINRQNASITVFRADATPTVIKQADAAAAGAVAVGKVPESPK